MATMDNHGEKLVLVLQGGGALGAYQAGVYEALSEAGYEPDWISGISIGSVNGAIIAGNPQEKRAERLREFWERISTGFRGANFVENELGRHFFNEASATFAVAFGIPGFFRPRFPPAFLHPPGAPEALSYYDMEPLHDTLHELIDFDYLNSKGPRLSLGAVNVRSGNFAYFDSRDIGLTPRHVMASGALPPGFPPILVDGDAFWDGALVSNTPLQYVLDGDEPRTDMCVFQVDLFNARGRLPKTLLDVVHREKDIRYSSRTRHNTDVFEEMQTLRRAARRLYKKLPEELRNDEDALFLDSFGCDAAITIVHLINRCFDYESDTKTHEFSRRSAEEHWAAGRADVQRTLEHEEWTTRRKPKEGVTLLDLTRPDP